MASGFETLFILILPQSSELINTTIQQINKQTNKQTKQNKQQQQKTKKKNRIKNEKQQNNAK